MTIPASPASVPPDSFYRLGTAVQSGPPGSLVDTVELTAPQGTRAWAVLYRSRSADGRTVPVSGIVLAPAGSPPSGGYPVVAWAHGTTGLADACAPSRDGLGAVGLPQLAQLARAGFAVAASDYEGLGTTGIHPYLVGISEGHSVLDSIRAARTLTAPGTDQAAREPSAGPGTAASDGAGAAVIGISQGGHAALWAAELAPRYAPEVRLLGAVAASPPIDLRLLQRDVLGPDASPRPVSWMEALMVVSAWHEFYALPTDALLTGEGMRLVERLRDECPGALPFPAADPFRVDPTTRSDWQSKLEENSPGHHAADAPILVLAARQDEQVPAVTIAPGVDRLCAAGSTVQLEWVQGGHSATVTSEEGANLAFSWLRDRFLGRPVRSNCR